MRHLLALRAYYRCPSIRRRFTGKAAKPGSVISSTRIAQSGITTKGWGTPLKIPAGNSSSRHILLLGSAHHDLERIVRQRSLQQLRFIPRRPHPNVAFLIRGQDHRHRLRMDRVDHGVRRRRQEAVGEMRPGDRLGLGTALAFEFGPDAREAVLIGNSLSFRT
jgi:hypothetical protein